MVGVELAHVVNTLLRRLYVLQLGYTPLHHAAQQGHVLVITILLKYGASPDAVSTVRYSYFMCIFCYIYNDIASDREREPLANSKQLKQQPAKSTAGNRKLKNNGKK